MSLNTSSDSKAIFNQLRDLPPGSSGVHAVIENHDAWLHSSATLFQLDAGVRAELRRRAATGPQAQRITAQHQALGSLITLLPNCLASAV